MQFVANGPDIPDALLQSHEAGRVVFFCGAGISYPAGLPRFEGLVRQLYDRVGERQDGIEQEWFKAKQSKAIRSDTRSLRESRPGWQAQYAGRLHREHASKTDVRIIDFVDTGHPALLRMWDKRQRGDRAMGYRIGVDATGDDGVPPRDLGKPVPATEHPTQKALVP